MVVSLILTTAVIEVPFLAAAFEFTPIDLNEHAVALGLAVLIILIMEIVKFFQRKLGTDNSYSTEKAVLPRNAGRSFSARKVSRLNGHIPGESG